MPEEFELFYTKTSPFSQFYPVRFVKQYANSDGSVRNVTFISAEQAMMFGKAILFADHHYAQEILKAKTPSAAKKFGRLVRGFDPKVWDENKVKIVYDNNYAKFTQNPHLLNILLATGDKTLVEASPVDRIWGVGLASTNPLILNRANWRGQNLLGQILTQLRDNLKINVVKNDTIDDDIIEDDDIVEDDGI